MVKKLAERLIALRQHWGIWCALIPDLHTREADGAPASPWSVGPDILDCIFRTNGHRHRQSSTVNQWRTRNCKKIEGDVV